jgi:hypothetical protein
MIGRGLLFILKIQLHWPRFLAKTSVVWRCDDATLFALATLGDVTQIEMILCALHHPRLPRQVGWHDRSEESQIFIIKNVTNVNTT